MLQFTLSQLQGIGEEMWQKLEADERYTRDKSAERLAIIRPYKLNVPKVLSDARLLTEPVDFKTIMKARAVLTLYLLENGFNNDLARLSINDTPYEEEVRVMNTNFEFIIAMKELMASDRGYMYLLEEGADEEYLLKRLKLTDDEIAKIHQGMIVFDLMREIPYALAGGVPMFQVIIDEVLNSRHPQI